MSLKKIIGYIIFIIAAFKLVLGILFLLLSSYADEYAHSLKSILLGIILLVISYYLVRPKFSIGRLLHPELKDFPEVQGVKILSIKYSAKKHYFLWGSPDNKQAGSYKRKAWDVKVKNLNDRNTNVTLDFSLIDKNGVTQAKEACYFNLYPGETAEKKLEPRGNSSKNECETVYLKQISVFDEFSQNNKELNLKLGKAGDDKYVNYIVIAIMLCILFYYLSKWGFLSFL
jgi:hypothetical protein